MTHVDLDELRAKAKEEGEDCEVLEELERGTIRVGVRTSPEGKEEIFLEPILRLRSSEGSRASLDQNELRGVLDWLEASGYVLGTEDGDCLSFEKRVPEELLMREYAGLRAALSYLDEESAGGAGA
jgi:hypothetical protein